MGLFELFNKKNAADVSTLFTDENNNQHIGIPEDIDKRISDFFDKHGINNLLIEFG